MRQTIDEYREDDAKVTIEFDTGGPVGSDHLVIVNGDDYLVNRWFYFDEFDERYARNFAKKIVEDDEYRQDSLDGTADWAQVADIYEEAALRIHDIFSDAGLMGYTVGDDEEERRYREASDVQERLCREIFEEVRDRIRHSKELDDLDRFIEERVDSAREAAEELQAD